jgi:phage-related tail protein
MSAAEKLKVEVLLAAIDKATRPFKAIIQRSSETARALKAAKDELKALNDAQGRIDAFRKTARDAAITSNQLKIAQDRVKALAGEMGKVQFPTKAMTRALRDAQDEAARLKSRHEGLIQKQQRLRTELNGAGMDTKNLSNHQRDLAKRIGDATAAVEKQPVRR